MSDSVTAIPGESPKHSFRSLTTIFAVLAIVSMWLRLKHHALRSVVGRCWRVNAAFPGLGRGHRRRDAEVAHAHVVALPLLDVSQHTAAGEEERGCAKY